MKLRNNSIKSAVLILIIAAISIVLVLAMSSWGSKVIDTGIGDKNAEELYSDRDLGINDNVNANLNGYRNILICDIGNKEVNSKSDNTPDSLIVLSLNNSTNVTEQFSIYRGTITQQSNGIMAVKSAYTNGGMLEQIKTVNENFDLNIRECITTNWEQVANLVDRLEGIQVYITRDVKDEANEIITNEKYGIHKTDLIEGEGTVNVTGWQAVAICCCDAETGGKGEPDKNSRHRQVLVQIIKKAANLSEKERHKAYKEFVENTESNIGKDKVFDLIERISNSTFANFDSTQNWPKEYDGNKPNTLESNVIGLYQRVFYIENYQVSSFVKEASTAIQNDGIKKQEETNQSIDVESLLLNRN